jgi:hypothetical protein
VLGKKMKEYIMMGFVNQALFGLFALGSGFSSISSRERE